MYIDFHCHTTASDGTLSPQLLVQRAVSRGLDSLSITDHDTVAAYTQIPASVPGLTVVPGIELSCQWQKRTIHIVGLNIDITGDTIAEAVAHMSQARITRAELIAEKLETYGIESPLQGAWSFASSGSIGRPHFARYLVESGFVNDEKTAFKKFLGTGKACDIKVCWPDLKTVVGWIRDAGGIAVIAHPGKYSLSRTKLATLLEAFTQCGGRAIEVVSGKQLPSETALYSALCHRFNLLASWGSDFHSPAQTWLDVGGYSTPPSDLTPVWDHWQ